MEKRLFLHLIVFLPVLLMAKEPPLFTVECTASTVSQLPQHIKEQCVPAQEEEQFYCLLENDLRTIRARISSEPLLADTAIAEHSKTEITEHYGDLIDRYNEKGLISDALAVSTALYRLFEDDASIAYGHTIALFRNDRYEDALDAARKLESDHPAPKHSRLVETITAALDTSTADVRHSTEDKAARYGDALKLFDEKKFPQAYIELERLHTEYPDDWEIAFFCGRSAFELMKFNRAEIAYRHAHLLKPDNPRITLELARTLFRVHKHEESKAFFAEVLASDPPQSVKKNIASYMEQIDHLHQRHHFSGLLRLGGGHDSNIDSISDLSSFSIYIPAIGVAYELPNSAKKEDAGFHEELLAVQYVYDIGDKNGWALRNSMALINRGYFSHSDKDVLYGSIAAGPAWRYDYLNVSLPLSVSAVRFGHHELFNEYGFHPEISLSLFNQTIIRIDGYGGHRIFRQSADKEKSSDIVTTGVNVSKTVDKDYSIQVGADFQKESKRDGTRTDVDFKAVSLHASLSARFYAKHALTLGYSHRTKEFEDYNILFLSKRDDTTKNHSASYDYLLSKNLMLSAQYTHTDNRSNHDPFIFKRDILSGSMSLKF